MATASGEGLYFELPVVILVNPKYSIGPRERERIFRYLQKELYSFQKHIEDIEEVNCICLTSVQNHDKGDIAMEFFVSSKEHLSLCYDKALKPPKKENEDNGLSYTLTKYFKNREMPTACGLNTKSTISFKVIMDENKRRSLEKKLEKQNQYTERISPAQRDSINQVSSVSENFGKEKEEEPPKQLHSTITKTFIVAADEKHVVSARIKSKVKEVNREIPLTRKNIYSVEIDLPSTYDPDECYWYTFTLQTNVVAQFFSLKPKKVKTGPFKLSNKTIHRDVIWELGNYYAHFEDIVHYEENNFNDCELCMQIEDLAHDCNITEVDMILEQLLKSGIIHSSKKMLRFCFLVGILYMEYPYKVKVQINAEVANEMLKSLFIRKMSDFPESASRYLPHLCVALLEITKKKQFCPLLCLKEMKSFLSTNDILVLFQELFTKCDAVLCADPLCRASVTEVCGIYFDKYIADNLPACLEVCNLLLRHIPIEVALENYGILKSKHQSEVTEEDDSLVALTATMQSRIIATSNKAIKDRNPKEVFEITIKAGSLMLTEDKHIRKMLEECIIRCFSSVVFQDSFNVKQHLEDVLTNSGCFIDCEMQVQLLRSIAESKRSFSRHLLIDFSRHSLMETAYYELDKEIYITYFTNQRYHTDIFQMFTALNEIRNIPAVQKRNDLRQALEDKAANILSKQMLKDLIENFEKIGNLCDSDNTISSLYKDQLQQVLKRRGNTPGEVLSYFCSNGRLRVNTRTTADIVCSIVGLFFNQLQESTMNDVFVSIIKHVNFWEIIYTGEGSLISFVEENKIVKHVKSSLLNVSMLLKQDETEMSFLSKIEIDGENTKKLLRLGGMTDSDIRLLKDRFSKRQNDITRTVSNVMTVLHAVKQQNIDDLQSELNVSIKRVQEISDRIKKGSISIKECSKHSLIWGDLEELPDVCSVLQPVIVSTVFWNLGYKLSLDEYNKTSRKFVSRDVISTIRFLFAEDETRDDDIILEEIKSSEQTIFFLKALKNEGLKAFEVWWTKLETDSSMTMTEVMMMFKNANVAEELNVAERFFKKPLKKQDTLLQLSKRDEVIEKAEAMKSVLIALGYDVETDEDMQKALNSFHKLINKDVSQSTLQDVQDSLDKIFSLANVLKEETMPIMAEIGKSTHLVDFLKEIAVEDVRNLIDAVEDISESHVQESTVSALIEVKRYLSPLLNASQINQNGSSWIFQTLQKQTDAIGENAGSLPGKISDCMLNIHNLKSLYGNVANRGHQTKEIIKSIITKGTFCFTLIPDEDRVTVDVSYKDNKHTYTKQEASITDMRSRALLLLNTDRHSKESSFNQEEFRHFIDCVDTCLETRDILCELFNSGHVRYSSINIKCRTNKLQEVKDRLRIELDEWLTQLHLARNKYYLMNFIQGFQIHCIHDYLECNVGEEKVNAILRFIHPQLSAVQLRQQFSSNIVPDNDLLEKLGTSLHSLYKGIDMFCRKIGNKERGTKITDSVQTGKLLVTYLDENSEYVIRTVLSLYQNTTDCLPEPNQLLFCSANTSWSDIELLVQRCIGAHTFYGKTPLFCLANVELLRNELQFRLVEILQELDDISNFLLAVVCCGSKHQLFVDQLSVTISTIQPMSEKSVETIYHSNFKNVFAYTSDVAGLGKSTAIKTYANDVDRSTVIVHVSGNVKRSEVIESLNGLKIKEYHVLHIDIGNVHEPDLLDTFLFELIVMKFIASGRKLFYLQTDHVCLEIANTINNSLTNKLQTPTSFTRQHMQWTDFNSFMPSLEINSSVQVVCHYLNKLENNLLDREELKFCGSTAVKPLSVSTCRALLQKYLCFSTDISFSTVNIFINVLADQLKKLSSSTFFKVSRISEMIGDTAVPSVRSNLAKAMIDVSLEFASRSVKACRSAQISSTSGEKAEKQYEKDFADRLVERVECMIRWEDSNHLIYVFHKQNIQTLSPMYRDKSKVPQHIKQLFESQMRKTLQDFSSMDQVQLQNMLQRVARSNPTPLSAAKLQKLSAEYALTPDNLLKMVLIMMRIQSKVPVVIMGETGCGKTSLIRYLANICEIPFRVLNIHAGINAKQIQGIVLEENKTCLENPKTERWLFLDEINTSESIGLICDIICHQRCNGTFLSPNFVIMGACNPYRLRSANAIQTAGLSEKVRTDQLSKLVYRVLPLPEMMVDYVWDFGSLSPDDEKKYIERIIEGVFSVRTVNHALLRDLIIISQSFVRDKEKSACVVSLRDVQRCKTLLIWFRKTMTQKVIKLKPVQRAQCDSDVKAIILALAHCYHSRFLNKDIRCEYRQRLVKGFYQNKLTHFTENLIYDVIKEEQRDIIDRMTLPQGTARNMALQENIFVILVCILNKIPIFVVGKPGCSKSLAMQVIRSNLRGKDSKDDFFKQLPQLYCVSFQGSESSTSDGIIKVFERAEIYQKDNSKDSVLSVVILDEIGLAEISKFNPLKVLHNLLEPNGKNVPDVAVVGISNWALDASKMNRAIHLSRPDMDVEELNETAVAISESFVENTSVEVGLTWSHIQQKVSIDEIKEDLRQVAYLYDKYIQEQQYRNFHGLRDFYSLVKFISRTFVKGIKFLNPENKSSAIMEGLLRNFGGLKAGRGDLLNHFNQCFQNNREISCSSVVDLIKSNITDDMARHLMIITKGESIMELVNQILRESNREKKEVIFGSRFEEDLTDDYNYRILSRIILCMEQGVVLVLKDLDHIYGSLYDMLNQNYTKIGKKNNCRIALGPYSSPFCHVAESFRCIVLVEESRLDYTDPPFLNRFEKQFLSFSNILKDEQSNLVEELKEWVENITRVYGMEISADNAFPYYNEELLVSLVINENRKQTQQTKEHLLDLCKRELLWIIRPEVMVRLPNVVAPEIQMISDSIRQDYFDLPLHSGIGCFVKHQLVKQEQLTIIFTNSNIHCKLSVELTDIEYQSEKLGSFKSEKQLSLKLQQFWKNEEKNVLFVHCSAVDDEQHIMLTKALIEKNVTEHQEQDSYVQPKFVFLVIHLGKKYNPVDKSMTYSSISQINYLSGWKLVLVDCLEMPKIGLPQLCSRTLQDTIESLLPLLTYLKEELFWSFTRIQYGPNGRNDDSIRRIMSKISSSESLLTAISECVWNIIKQTLSGEENEDWCLHVACDIELLNTSIHFTDALDRKIRQVIRNPFAKLIYRLEVLGALESFFEEDEQCCERRAFWCANVGDEKIMAIDSVQDVSGPACYSCNTSDSQLKMPFSRYIFESIEETKYSFTDEVIRTKVKCELESDDSLPDEVYEVIVLQQQSYISTKIPDVIDTHAYKGLMSDYINDFCNLFSYTFSVAFPTEKRINYLKWAFGHKVDLKTTDILTLFAHIHCAGWTHFSLLNSTFKLLELCHNVFNFDALELFSKFTKTEHNLTEHDGSYHSEIRCDGEHLSAHAIKQIDTNFPLNDITVDQSLDNIARCNSQLSTIEDKLEESKYAECEQNSEETTYRTSSVTVVEFSKRDSLATFTEDKTKQIEEVTSSKEYSGGGKDVKTSNVLEAFSETSGKEEHDSVKSTERMMFSQRNIVAKANSSLYPRSSSVYNNYCTKITVTVDDADDNIFNALVAFICKKVLPTSENMRSFCDVKHWQITAKNILILASEVSTDCPELHELRLCDDIVSEVLLPHFVDAHLLEILAESMVEKGINSNEVFSVIVSLLNENEGNIPSWKLQRMLCQFLIRCLSTNPSTNAYQYLFTAISVAELPDKDMQLLKPPLRYLIQQELDENADVLLEILQGNERPLSTFEKEQDKFISDLDTCLKSLNLNELKASRFELLIVDLLQEMLNIDIDDERCGEILLSCGKCIQQDNCGLKFATSVAFLKKITEYFTGSLCTGGQSPNLLTDVDAVFSGLRNESRYTCLLEYFIKCLLKHSSVHKVIKLCKMFEQRLHFVRSIKWSDDLSMLLEENPFCTQSFAMELKESKRLMRKEQTLLSFKNSLCQLQELAGKSFMHEDVIIFATAMHEFYMPRNHRFLDGTDRHRANMFYEMFKIKYTDAKKVLLECLLGIRDFEISELRHSEESSLQQCFINSVLVSAQIFSVCSKGEGFSILKTCVLKPSFLKTAFLPGFPDGTWSNIRASSDNSYTVEFILCQCETRLAIIKYYSENFNCVNCKRNLQFKETVKQDKRTDHTDEQMEIPNPGFNQTGNFEDNNLPIRSLSPVAVNIVQMLIKGCLLGAVNIKSITVSEIKELITGNVLTADCSLSLGNEISQHWANLGRMLNFNEHDLGCFLHIVLVKAERLLYEGSNQFTTIQERNIWEENFEEIISNLLMSRANAINETRREHVHRFGLSFQSMEVKVHEVEDINKPTEGEVCQDKHFKELFRLATTPSKTDFVCQLFALRKEFPFLARVIENEDSLFLPKNIYNIVHWHISTVVKISYKLKRQDCLTMSVQEFLDRNKDAGQYKSLHIRFKALQKSWIQLKRSSKGNSLLSNLKEINYETKMQDCLILDEECDIYKVLVYLVKTQNDFVDKSLEEAFSCRNLHFLRRNDQICCVKSVSVTNLTKNHLIDTTFEWTNVIVQESNSKLEYGLGKQVDYDFQNIEKEIAVDLLVKSAYINLKSLPQIIFVDELYKNFVELISNVSESVHQEYLSSDIESFFVKKNLEYPNMSLELLNHLDMILTLLKNAKCDHQKPLKEFVEERIVILGKSFPMHYLPSPENRLKLCHVVSLHEVLEELSAERVIGGFSYEFNAELEKEIQDHLTKVTALSIRRSEIVLKSIKRFVYRCMYMGDSNPEEELLHYLSHPSFWPENYLRNGKLYFEDKEEKLADIIPSTIRVCHVVEMVKHMQDSVEKHREGGVRIENVITSWKKKPDQISKESRQKKAVRKIRKS